MIIFCSISDNIFHYTSEAKYSTLTIEPKFGSLTFFFLIFNLFEVIGLQLYNCYKHECHSLREGRLSSTTKFHLIFFFVSGIWSTYLVTFWTRIASLMHIQYLLSINVYS